MRRHTTAAPPAAWWGDASHAAPTALGHPGGRVPSPPSSGGGAAAGRGPAGASARAGAQPPGDHITALPLRGPVYPLPPSPYPRRAHRPSAPCATAPGPAGRGTTSPPPERRAVPCASYRHHRPLSGLSPRWRRRGVLRIRPSSRLRTVSRRRIVLWRSAIRRGRSPRLPRAWREPPAGGYTSPAAPPVGATAAIGPSSAAGEPRARSAQPMGTDALVGPLPPGPAPGPEAGVVVVFVCLCFSATVDMTSAAGARRLPAGWHTGAPRRRNFIPPPAPWPVGTWATAVARLPRGVAKLRQWNGPPFAPRPFSAGLTSETGVPGAAAASTRGAAIPRTSAATALGVLAAASPGGQAVACPMNLRAAEPPVAPRSPRMARAEAAAARLRRTLVLG